MNNGEIIFVGSYGGRGTRLLRPDGTTYTNGGPKSLIFVGQNPLGIYSIKQAADLGIQYFLVSVNREEDRVCWSRIFDESDFYRNYMISCIFGLHEIGKPTNVFMSRETLNFLSAHPDSPILWCFGDDYLPQNHLKQIVELYRISGTSVATRKSVDRFKGALQIAPIYDENYIIHDWVEGRPEWVANPPMIISPYDRDLFLLYAEYHDTAGVYMRTYKGSRKLRTVDWSQVINVNTWEDLQRVFEIIGCQLPSYNIPF